MIMLRSIRKSQSINNAVDGFDAVRVVQIPKLYVIDKQLEIRYEVIDLFSKTFNQSSYT